MPLVQTRGAASAQGFGEFAQAAPVIPYIEDVFSTYLYTGDGSSAQNINNGIDLAGKGGMVWVKGRSNATTHVIVDTNRFISSSNIQNLFSDSTAAASASANEFGSFNSNGFSIPYNTTAGWTNFGTRTFASWTFRKQEKFFDIVTYTGNGAGNQVVAHNLGSEPGCIFAKKTSSTSNWIVYHRGLSGGENIRLNTAVSAAGFGSPDPLSLNGPASFNVGAGPTADDNLNDSGQTYVAYLFAHNAGGFGLTGTDNVISCGSVSATGGTLAEVNLGWEPQWLLIKGSSIANGWSIIDNMRGFTANSGVSWLQPNTSAAEVASPTTPSLYLTSTGFKVESNESPLNGTGTYIYIAIRRGPMKVPTTGTSVFSPILNGAGTAFNVGFVPDMNMTLVLNGASQMMNGSRLTGNNNRLEFNNTNAQQTFTDTFIWNGVSNTFTQNIIGGTPMNEMFKRAPSFFDEVCYTGTGSAATPTHNLAAIPEIIIVKRRTVAADEWTVRVAGTTGEMYLNRTNAQDSSFFYLGTPTSTTFNLLSGGTQINATGNTYVAYLFATCAGVSKVGTYTGNGTTQTIDCGFTGGARFVLIKRTNATGDWYVYDTTRGMTVLTNPYVFLNSNAAEVATLGSVTTVSTGFALNSAIVAAINVNAGTYIFLAIA